MHIGWYMSVEISVIMSVYNTKEEYLKDAINSVLNQTFKNFEFIIINDCSDEKTTQILESYNVLDKRIILISNSQNLGLTESLNIGLSKSSGKYIARMDADDISFSDRFEKQYRYMEKHQDIDVLGGWVKVGKRINKSFGKAGTKWRQVRMLIENAGICHSTAFIRKKFLDDNNLKYDVNIKKAQDYDLWCRCVDVGNLKVMPRLILKYRVHDEQISIKNRDEQEHYIRIIRKKRLDKLQFQYTKKELEQFLNMSKEILSAEELDAFFEKIIKSNKKLNILDNRILRYELTKEWMKILIGKYERNIRKEYLWRKWVSTFLNPIYGIWFVYNHILRKI